MPYRMSSTVALVALLGLTACAEFDPASFDPTRREATVTTSTIGLTYSGSAMTTDQAKATVRTRCTQGEVVSITEPVEQGGNQFRITATCMASYDKNGNLIPNG